MEVKTTESAWHGRVYEGEISKLSGGAIPAAAGWMFVVLAGYCRNKEKRWKVSHRELAEKSGLSIEYTRKLIYCLRDNGLISVEETFNKWGWQDANYYTLLHDVPGKKTTPPPAPSKTADKKKAYWERRAKEQQQQLPQEEKANAFREADRQEQELKQVSLILRDMYERDHEEYGAALSLYGLGQYQEIISKYKRS